MVRPAHFRNLDHRHFRAPELAWKRRRSEASIPERSDPVRPESRWDPLDEIVLPAGAQLAGHFEPDLLGGVYVVTAQGLARDAGSWDEQLYRPRRVGGGKEVEFRAVPYAFWGNRGLGKMMVWLDTVL